MALQYGTASSLTITAGSLASAGNRSSASVTTDTTKNIAQILLEVSILTTSTAPSGNKKVDVYGYCSTDGTNYGGASGTVDDVDGTDKALTAIGSPTNLTYLGSVYLNQGAVARTVRGEFEVTGPIGRIPPKWGIVLYNDAGTALGATVSAQYREVYYT
jgi:hypothetical protein